TGRKVSRTSLYVGFYVQIRLQSILLSRRPNHDPHNDPSTWDYLRIKSRVPDTPLQEECLPSLRPRPHNTQGCSPSDLKALLLHADKKRTHLMDPNSQPSTSRGEYSDEQYAESVPASRE